MITTTIDTAKKQRIDQKYKYSLQNLTTEKEYLSDNIDELKTFLESDESNDDFLFWDNQENCDLYVQLNCGEQ